MDEPDTVAIKTWSDQVLERQAQNARWRMRAAEDMRDRAIAAFENEKRWYVTLLQERERRAGRGQG